LEGGEKKRKQPFTFNNPFEEQKKLKFWQIKKNK
jgi:hypothetical protein